MIPTSRRRVRGPGGGRALPPGSAVARRVGMRGQALVEFAMVVLPLLLIVVGVIQFGLLLGANVSLTNAAREGARAASIFVYDGDHNRALNDLDRCSAALEAAIDAFGLLSPDAPNFSATPPCPAASASNPNGDGFNDRWDLGDFAMSYCTVGVQPDAACPTSGVSTTYCTVTDGGGCLVRVELIYSAPVIVPFLDAILDGDGDGYVELRARATMVMN